MPINDASISSAWCRSLHHHFADWLLQRSSNSTKVVETYERQWTLVAELERHFDDEQAIDGDELIEYFGAARLRRNLLAKKFLTVHLHASLHGTSVDRISAFQEVVRVLEKARDHPWERLLLEYHASLKHRALAPRTLKAYLAAATRLFKSAKVLPERKPTQAAVDRLLRRLPGFRASLYPLVTLGKEQWGWPDITLHASRGLASDGRDRTKKKVSALLESIERVDSDEARCVLLPKLLSQLYGVRISRIRNLRRRDFESSPTTIIFSALSLRLDRRLNRFFTGLLDTKLPDDHLFS